MSVTVSLAAVKYKESHLGACMHILACLLGCYPYQVIYLVLLGLCHV